MRGHVESFPLPGGLRVLIVETIDSLARLAPLEKEWRQLELYSGLPFTSWDWTVAWWNQLREDKLGVKDSLFVRAIRTEAGELVAVAPMLISRRPSIGPLCIRQLQFFGADPNITEVRGMLALPEWRTEAYRALIQHALEHADQWDSMLLSGLPSEIDDAELAFFGQFEWAGQTLDYVLPLPGSWEELRSGLSRNIKESLRKCYNSLKRDNREFRLQIAEDPAHVSAALERFFAFHGARAQLTDTVPHGNVFDTAEARRFLSDVCDRFAQRGCLRIFQLLVDEQVVAVRVGFVIGGSLYLYYSGYDQAFAQYSVMTTTVAEAIKYAIAQGMKAVNLSTGNDVSKARWNPVEVAMRQALLVSPSRRGELARDVYRHAVGAIEDLPALRFAVKFLARRGAPPPSQRPRA
jgi:CelD/BcsL family acetyltransferase involved in cellulose biosynthesis